MQTERGDGSVVALRARRMALQRHRNERGGSERRDEHECGLVAHCKAEHGDARGDQRCGDPGLTDPDFAEELPHRCTKTVIDAQRYVRYLQECEESGDRRGDCEEGGGCCGKVERRVELTLGVRSTQSGAQRETGEYEGADRAGCAEVDEQLGDRQTPPHDRTWVGQELRGCTAAKGERNESRQHRHEQKGCRTSNADKTGH